MLIFSTLEIIIQPAHLFSQPPQIYNFVDFRHCLSNKVKVIHVLPQVSRCFSTIRWLLFFFFLPSLFLNGENSMSVILGAGRLSLELGRWRISKQSHQYAFDICRGSFMQARTHRIFYIMCVCLFCFIWLFKTAAHGSCCVSHFVWCLYVVLF